RREETAEVLEGAARPRLYRLHRQVEHTRDLRVRHLLARAHADHVAIVRWELRECAVDRFCESVAIQTQLRSGIRLRRTGPHAQPQHALDEAAPRALLLELVQRAVPRCLEKVRLQSVADEPGRAILPDAHEYALHDLLRSIRGGHVALDEAAERLVVGVEECLECLLVTIADPLDI